MVADELSVRPYVCDVVSLFVRPSLWVGYGYACDFRRDWSVMMGLKQFLTLLALPPSGLSCLSLEIVGTGKPQFTSLFVMSLFCVCVCVSGRRREVRHFN